VVPSAAIPKSPQAFSRLGGCQGRSDDVRIGAAAAEVSADRGIDLVNARVRRVLQQCRTAHHHPGRTEAALQRVVLDEGGLHRMKVFALRQAFDRHHAAGADLDGEHHAGTDRDAVKPHGAG
jgi:hypothetical protein